MRFPTPVFQAPDSPTTSAPSSASPASTPSTTPSATPASENPSPPSSDVVSSPSDGADSSLGSFDFMFGPEGGDPSEGLGSSPPGTVTPEPKPAQPAQAEPAKPAVKAPEPAKPDPATATPAPTETTSPTTATQPQPTLDPFDPGALARHLTENEQEVVQHVADTLFKLSDKDVEALESDTVGTIPKLLARAFVASQRNFLMQMQNIVPMMVQRHGEVTKRHSEAEGEFYSRWPDIKKDQHGPLVMQYAAVFRQMHPQATRKEMIEALGPMVMMAAKVVPSVTQPSGTVPKASPMINGNGRAPQPAPFVPAGPSAGGGAPSTAPQPTVYETMFADRDE